MIEVLISILLGSLFALPVLSYMGAWRQPPPQTNKLLRQIGQDGSMWQRRPWFVIGSVVGLTAICASLIYTVYQLT